MTAILQTRSIADIGPPYCLPTSIDRIAAESDRVKGITSAKAYRNTVGLVKVSISRNFHFEISHAKNRNNDIIYNCGERRGHG